MLKVTNNSKYLTIKADFATAARLIDAVEKAVLYYEQRDDKQVVEEMRRLADKLRNPKVAR
ncbi:hypothetical protein [Aeribacillus composti]|uniref:hypothetical protein n=1 Tax=Aeribacillus composti TaxID=1868734 RepID=UPI002E1A09F9|nr:hypothetical protein [Aeribacillus composti]